MKKRETTTALKRWRESQPAPPDRPHRAGVKRPYLSQREAAKRAGCALETWRCWERGVRAADPAVLKRMGVNL